MLKFINCVSKGLVALEILQLDAVRVDVVVAVTAVVMAPVMAARNVVMLSMGSVGLSSSLLSHMELFLFTATCVFVKSKTNLQPSYSSKKTMGLKNCRFARLIANDSTVFIFLHKVSYNI